ncbi:hypothetical protein L917_02586 [Phytophthora nicotianae]|uniref:Uncharacterized protein n=1 Tax=Phytophthora nicotianae TaxID=4792 RepID=W2LTA0_PHYNI|nr:hypothetical protein L916_02645 [Phytophthora nicotianae]ETM00714.1 hypothetical protein L917_02586 [Phytophthora nicotianae]
MSVEKIRGNINSNTKSSTMAKIEGTEKHHRPTTPDALLNY